MKKLLAGVLCALSLAMPVCAVNDDVMVIITNALGNSAVDTDNEIRDVQRELYRVLNRALSYCGWYEDPEFSYDTIDTISSLIRNGAEIDDRILSDNNFLVGIVFHNPIFNQFPEDIRNHILGKALLYFVKNRHNYVLSHGRNQNNLKFNYNTICALLKLHPPINFTDDNGLTALQIAGNRYNTWQYGAIPDDVRIFIYGDNSNDCEKVREKTREQIKKHDAKVFRLLTMNARHNQQDECCTIC